MGLPERLKLARTKRGMTQRKAAQAADVDPNAIWRYEAGRSRPSGVALRGLADIYETTVSWLLSDEDEGAGTRRPVDIELNGQSAVHAESIQLLGTLDEGLSDEALRSISDFISYLHEFPSRERENGGSVTPLATQSERPSNTAHPDGRVNV